MLAINFNTWIHQHGSQSGTYATLRVASAMPLLDLFWQGGKNAPLSCHFKSYFTDISDTYACGVCHYLCHYRATLSRKLSGVKKRKWHDSGTLNSSYIWADFLAQARVYLFFGHITTHLGKQSTANCPALKQHTLNLLNTFNRYCSVCTRIDPNARFHAVKTFSNVQKVNFTDPGVYPGAPQGCVGRTYFEAIWSATKFYTREIFTMHAHQHQSHNQLTRGNTYGYSI